MRKMKLHKNSSINSCFFALQKKNSEKLHNSFYGVLLQTCLWYSFSVPETNLQQAWPQLYIQLVQSYDRVVLEV